MSRMSLRFSAALVGIWLFGCGGNVTVEDGGAGQGGGGGWQPCAGKRCGDDCTWCDPNDPSCELPGTITTCDQRGECIIGQATCVGGCRSDEDCTFGAEWCIAGECAPCDNSGQVCDINCEHGWRGYERHGCTPCACAPGNDCDSDAECAAGEHCYAGAFCWEGCAEGDPSCCQGNICSAAGCPEPPPVGCVVRGCPMGDVCDTFAGCASSGCSCGGGFWGCDDDCGGGVCLTPL